MKNLPSRAPATGSSCVRQGRWTPSFRHTASTVTSAICRYVVHFPPVIVKKPRTTIFSDANPYSEATTLTILWNTADADALQTLHHSVVACFSEHGFSPFKEATQLLHSGVYAYRDRRDRKGQFRRLWITRIGAGARQNGLSYSRLMNGLSRAGVELDRKVLADLAVNDPAAFATLVEAARQSLPPEQGRAGG